MLLFESSSGKEKMEAVVLQVPYRHPPTACRFHEAGVGLVVKAIRFPRHFHGFVKLIERDRLDRHRRTRPHLTRGACICSAEAATMHSPFLRRKS